MFQRKVKIHCPADWSHHRHGWNYVVNSLKENLHNDLGVDFFTNGLYAKMISSNEFYEKPWIGILHLTPSDPGMGHNLENNKAWHRSLEQCHGLYTLSNHGRKFLEKYVNCKVERLYYPGTPGGPQFDPMRYEANMNKKVYFVGHWLRRFEPFFELKTNHKKIAVRCSDTHIPSSIDTIQYLPPTDYDKIFTDNILFLSLLDSSTNTTVLECIKSSTPIIVNRLPALEEYLGRDYPLFYQDLQEAENVIDDHHRIISGHEYLLRMDKSHLNIDRFLKDIAESSIYRSLKITKFL